MLCVFNYSGEVTLWERAEANNIQELIKNQFGFDLRLLLAESKLLQKKKEQTKLNDFPNGNKIEE